VGIEPVLLKYHFKVYITTSKLRIRGEGWR